MDSSVLLVLQEIAGMERNGILFPERTLGIAGISKRNPAKKEWNGTECRNSLERGGSRIAGTKKGMHNRVLCAGDRISRIHPHQRWN